MYKRKTSFSRHKAKESKPLLFSISHIFSGSYLLVDGEKIPGFRYEFMDSLFSLFSGCYDNLEFNIHLWFLPCFFVTVILFNILVNLGGRRMAYLVSALMSLALIEVPMHGLIWGIDRVFKYIGFYAVGVFIAGKSVRSSKEKRWKQE